MLQATRARAGGRLFRVLIGALILPRAGRLLWETTSVLLESTPRGLDLDDVRAHLLELEHVRGADQHVERQRLGRRRALDEVHGSVDMSRRVRSEIDAGEVDDVAVRE